ncbi:MAG TPA: copper resistance protein NlpE N-terminal domain-containing protein [Pyrinomonadaceae bacterium]|nr:copper resistance protein NlpE N-terminal domain-containing protein [Pyrinomonadaceae bacterium]
MKSILIFSSLALLLPILLLPVPPSVAPSSSTHGVFVATSPCDDVSRQLLQIPATAKCEMIKWSLNLHQDANTLIPTTYSLSLTYGLPEQGTKGLANGGTMALRQGQWTMVRGTKANGDALVYRLDPGGSQRPVSFLKADHNLLHLLDGHGNLAVGNAGWSYTLSRSGKTPPNVQQDGLLESSAVQLTSPSAFASSIRSGPSTLGRFFGRSPCQQVAKEINKPVSGDCMKVKWDLTLYQDQTLSPTTYKLRGTFYRERIREGTWRIVRGTKANPAAVVYQLDPANSEASLFFLKADDNILFFLDQEKNLMPGNADFSYTLNKADETPKN